ncbi:MAG TPA: c-type cytochrome [Verrucomicrobia bacterium]|nr:c-type cytochrome [Verrucomicrobiota bacterium]HOP97259.1 c-type cytochrome [Verrucomicrobiota bacterium]
MKIAERVPSVVALLAAVVPVAAQTPSITAARDALASGRVVYDRHCAACHGAKGDGNGPASVWLYPKPRNFSAGLFKIKSTPGQSLPTDEDLFQTITRGMPGSSMPSFSYLSEQERRDVVAYVKSLTAYVDASGKRVNRFEEAAEQGLIGKPVEVPPEPAIGVQELVLGREVYTRMACQLCHGDTGAGDGPQVPTLRDAAGLPIVPRDFNTGLFRGGHTGRDLYLRIHNGLPGTPMIPYGEGVLTPEERWALVHYVQSLRRTEVAVNDLLTPEDGAIRVQRVSKLPADPMDTLWERFDPVRVPLNPLWPEPQQVYAVAVSAVTDGRRLAVLLQWRDELPQDTAIRVQDFQDAAAVQFSMTGEYGFLGMGDTNHAVNIWHWKAGWQTEVERGAPDPDDVYNSMHVDAWTFTNFNTAASAGNVISLPHKSPIEDANARGFGSFRSQPISRQNVTGKGIWHDGFWSVMFVRELRSRDPDDVQFTRRRAVPVAFAVWNGEQGDRNGRKMISNWYQLVFEEGGRSVSRR